MKDKKKKMTRPQHFFYNIFTKTVLSSKLLRAVIDGKKIILIVGSK